jgi:hypothetical protein
VRASERERERRRERERERERENRVFRYVYVEKKFYREHILSIFFWQKRA